MLLCHTLLEFLLIHGNKYFIIIINYLKIAERREVQEEDVLIFDIDNAVYVKDLNLPPIPEPEATVLIGNLKSLTDKKEAFINGINTSKEKMVNLIFYKID